MKALAIHPSVDALAALREERDVVVLREKALTCAIRTIMAKRDVRVLAGATHHAVLDTRLILTPNPREFLAIAGDRATLAMKVEIERARTLIGSAELMAISLASLSYALRVEDGAS